jgi:hypothetical protein
VEPVPDESKPYSQWISQQPGADNDPDA